MTFLLPPGIKGLIDVTITLKHFFNFGKINENTGCLNLLKHCVKKVRMRSFSGPQSCIRTAYGYLKSKSPYSFNADAGKYGPEKTPCSDILHAVKLAAEFTTFLNYDQGIF